MLETEFISSVEKEDYKKWIVSLCDDYKRSQIKASISVNSEMLKFYWRLGREISILHFESVWGSKFLETLSNDLKKSIPNAKCFSVTNLGYIKRFYQLYSIIHPQLGDELSGSKNSYQNMNKLFLIPWGHHKYIMDKSKGDVYKALFYVGKTIENNWSRAVLLNFLETDLYERQGKAISNFENRLPNPTSDLAQEITKDPYNFDFLAIKENYDEKELKKALIENIQKFLLELGTGFAFVGKEYRLVVGNSEEYLDLLLYNIKLHCYVVVEVKVNAFRPQDIGQIGTYVTAVNHILKGEKDEPTIGLLICKTKDNVLAQYAAESSYQPIGISEYQLSNMIEESYKGTLPSIEEIEKNLKTDKISKNEPLFKGFI